VYLDAGYSYAFYNRAVGDYRIELNEVIHAAAQLSTALPQEQAVLISQLLETTLPSFEAGLRARQKVLESPPPTARASALARDTSFSVGRAILEGHQRYTDIRAPVLAIYAVPHRTPATVGTDSTRLARWRESQNQVAAQADAFERGIAGARVVRIPNADHFVYRSNEADVLREIRLFVRGLAP
jgi:pimeloyl-ACP methyl ester carboxylesterase